MLRGAIHRFLDRRAVRKVGNKGERLVLSDSWERAKAEGGFGILAHLQRYEWVFDHVHGSRVGKLIDVGCGSGYGSAWLAGQLGSAQVLGIDVSEDAVSYASRKFQLPNLSFAQCDALGLSDLGNMFNVAVSFDVIEHIERERQGSFVASIADALAPGGLLFVGAPNGKVSRRPSRHHRHEPTAREFRCLLDTHFGRVRTCCQDLVVDGVRCQSSWGDHVSSVPSDGLGIFEDMCDEAFGLLAVCAEPTGHPPSASGGSRPTC